MNWESARPDLQSNKPSMLTACLWICNIARPSTLGPKLKRLVANSLTLSICSYNTVSVVMPYYVLTNARTNIVTACLPLGCVRLCYNACQPERCKYVTSATHLSGGDRDYCFGRWCCEILGRVSSSWSLGFFLVCFLSLQTIFRHLPFASVKPEAFLKTLT